MFGWYFKWWRNRQLKMQSHIPHKLKLNKQRLKTECVYEIKESYKLILYNIERLKRKLEVKDAKKKVIETDRDEHGIEKEKKDIQFTQNEIEKMKSMRRFYWFIVFLFVLAESGLYYLTAQVFLPGGAEPAKLILASFLGLVVMVILNFAFEKHFEYREILANKEKLNIEDNLIVAFTDMIQETGQLDLFKNLSAKNQINALLKKAPLPDFNKSDIFIMTGEQPKIKIEKYELLKEFWKDYFSKTNLNLLQYDSGGENLLVNKINAYKGEQ